MKKSLIANALFLLVSLPALAAQQTVTFDDTKTSVEALTQATTNAGYPSTLKQPQAKQE